MVTTVNTKTLHERLIAAGIIGTNGSGPQPSDTQLWEDTTLPLALIRFDPTYQRDVRQSFVKKISEHFDPLLCEPPLVNWREDGSFYGMDGQHRIMALLERFGERAQWTCRLFYGLTIKQEALLFNTQDQRRPLTPLERFRSGVISGSEPYMAINAVVESTGWTVALYTGQHARGSGIVAVGALVTIHKNYKGNHLYKTLTIIRECFGGDHAPPSSLLLGFSQFNAWYEGEYDRRALVQRMRDVGMSGLRMEADKRRLLDRVTGTEAVGMAIVSLYNVRRRPEHRLLAWETVLQTRKGGGKVRGGSDAIGVDGIA